MKTPPAIDDFLRQKRIAVTGVSRDTPNQPANVIYRRLRESGFEVFAVNPNADRLEGDPAYASLAEIPGPPVDGVVVASHPSAVAGTVEECIALGVGRVWMHRSFGQGSVAPEAVVRGRQNGLQVIDGGCPMMFCEPVDLGHKCMRWILMRTGGIPEAA